MTPDERAWWLLACALAAFVAAQMFGMCVEDDDPRSWWDLALALSLLAAAVLACGALATMATTRPY